MQPFDSMQFRHPWRPYQARVLGAVHDHLDDKRLHIVAAPGAGKTTLGLEIFRMLGKPALVLSPTRIIRDQWLERLKDFVPDVAGLSWISNSVHAPGILTSITYQALHAKFSEELKQESKYSGNATDSEDDGEDGQADDIFAAEADEDTASADVGELAQEEVNSFIRMIEENHFQVLILDEAHHLRSEWWRALEKVCEHFPDIVLVSLTATPPYDAQGMEWARYEQLCGPIDEEISVPELVKTGTLCAHQDFIWACDATVTEKRQIEEYDNRVMTLCDTLFNSDDFVSLVATHPWLNPEGREAEIVKSPETAIALLVFSKAKGLPKPVSLMQFLDMAIEDIPELGRHWWQLLTEALLFAPKRTYTEEQQQFIAQLKKQLKSSELLYKKELSLERSRRAERSLSLSASKVQACAIIHELEYAQRGASLRQVVLTDYIRDEELLSGLDTGEINLGAWPVFREITSFSPIHNQVGLLTGRLSIIPTGKLPLLLAAMETDNVRTEPMGQDDVYHKVIAPLNELTSAFTQLLMAGELKVLVGTRSLLGEGWDAPAINSLILASSVGSFMLTNQMRGRAIRIDKQVERKVSSIWHLFAVNRKSFSGWSDYYDLPRRFDTFVGVSENKRTIESGFERLNLPDPWMTGGMKEDPIEIYNREMHGRLRNINEIYWRWKNALTLDDSARVIPSVKVERMPRLRGMILRHSFAHLVTQIMAVVTTVLFYATLIASGSGFTIFWLFVIGVTAGVLYRLPKTIAMIRVLYRHLPVDGALKYIGRAVTEALAEAGLITTSTRHMKVTVEILESGGFNVALAGSTFYESSLFADCMAEVLSPLENPRYLLRRDGTFLRKKRQDYHAVPAKFAVKKDLAAIFCKAWNKYVSPSELIYTRSAEGREVLLKARVQSFSSVFEKEIKRLDKWQ